LQDTFQEQIVPKLIKIDMEKPRFQRSKSWFSRSKETCAWGQ